MAPMPALHWYQKMLGVGVHEVEITGWRELGGVFATREQGTAHDRANSTPARRHATAAA